MTEHANVHNDDPLLDVAAAAAYLDVSDRLVRDEIRRGRLRSVRVGRLLRIRVSALEQYLRDAVDA